MEDKVQKARELFMAGANCSQAVLGAFCEECHISQEMAFQIASGFGGGIARMREVCGAVSGMVLVANILWGNADIGDKTAKDGHYARIRRLTDAFRERNGSIVCRELLGLASRQIDTPTSEARTVEYYKKRPCVELVAIAAGILQTEIENTPQKSRELGI